MIRIEVEGTSALAAALRKVGDDIKDEVSKAVNATALEVVGDIKKRYNKGPASGRIYRKTNPRRIHQASAPGQAPATDTGRLVNSVTFERVDHQTADVFTLVDYGFYLEFGTRHIARRPAWRPAARVGAQILKRRLEGILRAAT